jgi:hypothetical protein
MFWLYSLMIVLGSHDQGAAEATDWMKPSHWTGNFWGPAATRARLTGQLPPLPTNPGMMRWSSWGRNVLRDGDIVFRLGDARTLRGTFPLSRFIAAATGSPFSHTGIVAVEGGSPVVYDCSSDGVQRQPFEVWMLDCIGPVGVKRLKPEHVERIPGVIAYCRLKFEQQVPFDYEFRPDDAALYCVELTEKAFRSQGLELSQPVRIGDWEHLGNYPLTALATPYVTKLMLERPISLEQPVYLPGNEHQGVWASSLLQTVVGLVPSSAQPVAFSQDSGLSPRGDLDLVLFVAGTLRRCHADLRSSTDIRTARAVHADNRRLETSPIAIDDHLPRQAN